jgi:hypothetical protein
MVNLDVAELRSKLDLDGKYVDFSLLRSTLSVITVVSNLDIYLTEPNKEGECRGRCPKCDKDRSFVVNINTNRFNCFGKGCNLKGGGVIDFFARLYSVSAKQASHLLAYVHGVQPYGEEVVNSSQSQPVSKSTAEPLVVEQKREVTEKFSGFPQTVKSPPLTPAHIIASIEHQLAQLKELLLPR